MLPLQQLKILKIKIGDGCCTATKTDEMRIKRLTVNKTSDKSLNKKSDLFVLIKMDLSVI
jgi:hypothetical protein